MARVHPINIEFAMLTNTKYVSTADHLLPKLVIPKNVQFRRKLIISTAFVSLSMAYAQQSHKKNNNMGKDRDLSPVRKIAYKIPTFANNDVEECQSQIDVVCGLVNFNRELLEKFNRCYLFPHWLGSRDDIWIEWRCLCWESFPEIKDLITDQSRVASLNTLFPEDCRETLADIRKNEETVQIVLGEIEADYMALFKTVCPVDNLYPKRIESYGPFVKPVYFCLPTERKKVADILRFVGNQAAGRVTSWTAAKAWAGILMRNILPDTFDDALMLLDGELWACSDTMFWGKTEDGSTDLGVVYAKILPSKDEGPLRTPPHGWSKARKVWLESRTLPIT